ncbi:TetR/AcrR family transcriptional regulator [bacterium]|nr:MAG: TetR/AcrR family transcriptional regulator [bacterium]
MGMEKVKKGGVVGRPRAFDPDQALEAALGVFKNKGYEGASLSDLTEAMGINRPSLYAAFGNKEELFRKALARYSAGPTSGVVCAMNGPTARYAAERLLHAAVEAAGCPDYRGCLTVVGALSCSEDGAMVQQELCAQRLGIQDALRDRFLKGQADGDLSPSADADALARFIATVHFGLSVQAASGATPENLRKVVETAFEAWPA